MYKDIQVYRLGVSSLLLLQFIRKQFLRKADPGVKVADSVSSSAAFGKSLNKSAFHLK